jgi:V/A-type H+-transporting ATPase subunit D
MARYGVAPTKTNLLRLRGEYSFVREGHQLLEQKKEILATELLSLLDRARLAEEQMDSLLRQAFETLRQSFLRMGRKRVSGTALGVKVRTRVAVSRRRVMGVTLPVVQLSVEKLALNFSPGDTSFWVDEATARFSDVVKDLGTLVETSVSARLLAREVKKTIRRVNAMEKIAIPDITETLAYITQVLEEMERQTFFTMKLVKNRLIRRRAESGG